jgi:hypothetical protein
VDDERKARRGDQGPPESDGRRRETSTAPVVSATSAGWVHGTIGLGKFRVSSSEESAIGVSQTAPGPSGSMIVSPFEAKNVTTWA